MQILSKNFILPQNTKNIDKKDTSNNFSVTPSFKSAKTRIIEGLTQEITNGIKLEGAKLTEILSNPQKRALFFEILGATIISSVTTIVNLTNIDSLNNEQTQVEDKNAESQSQNTENGNTKEQTLSSQIKFDATKGVAPQIEKDFIAFVNENFSSDQITSDRLKLLFNKFAAHNRKGSHVSDGNIVTNKDILAKILFELKEANSEKEKTNEIINKYQSLLKTDSQITPAGKNKIEIEISEEIKEILNRYNSIKKKYFEIIESSTTKKEAKERLKSIDNLLLTITDKHFPEYYEKCINRINTNYSDLLENIAGIINEIEEKDANKLYQIILDKELSASAVENWKQDSKKIRCPFSLYNELVKNNLAPATMKSLSELHYNGVFTDIKINSEYSEIKLSTPNTRSFNYTFSSIKQIFELVTGKKVTLRSQNDIKFNEELLTDELKKDYDKKKKSTYPNIIKYLYGNNFTIYNENSFDYKKMEHRRDLLIDILNNEEVFNPKLFSSHTKLRFLERFVLNEDFGSKTLHYATKTKIRNFIGSLKLEQQDGITIKPYESRGGFIGILMIIPTSKMGDIQITLDDNCKIHTIF